MAFQQFPALAYPLHLPVAHILFVAAEKGVGIPFGLLQGLKAKDAPVTFCKVSDPSQARPKKPLSADVAALENMCCVGFNKVYSCIGSLESVV